MYAWLAVAPVAVLPSPKFHAYEAIVPFWSLEAEPSTLIVSPLTPTVNEATGGGLVPPPAITT